MISAAGILVCLVTTFIATDLRPARLINEIENTLKLQLIVSTLLATPVRARRLRLPVCAGLLVPRARSAGTSTPFRVRSPIANALTRAPRAQVLYFVTVYTLPPTFIGIFTAEPLRVVKNWYPFVCVASGLWGGLIIGLVTEYYTSNTYRPVQARPPASWLRCPRLPEQHPGALRSGPGHAALRQAAG